MTKWQGSVIQALIRCVLAFVRIPFPKANEEQGGMDKELLLEALEREKVYRAPRQSEGE